MALERRKWCYVQRPRDYGIAPCACGNEDTQWSEYRKHLWCDKCQVDFIPEHNGIFDGPIPVRIADMMGISFARYDLETGEVIPFVIENMEYQEELREAWKEFTTKKDDDGVQVD